MDFVSMEETFGKMFNLRGKMHVMSFNIDMQSEKKSGDKWVVILLMSNISLK